MDADTLRLILFIAGIVLILGIYFIGKKKRPFFRIHATRKNRQDDDFDDAGYSDDELDDDVPESFDAADSWSVDQSEKIEPRFSSGLDVLAERPEGMRDYEAPEKPDSITSSKPKPEQAAFSFTADQLDDEEPIEFQYDGDAPVKIVQLNLAARSGMTINGKKLSDVCKEVGLFFGDMDIYHRYADEKPGKAIFSMASMVEPGTFPKKHLEDFETPGVVLFAQLPGPKDGLAMFSDMLFTAERMAALLDVELQDETHSALSKQTIEHIREEILEHRRKLQLSRSKR